VYRAPYPQSTSELITLDHVATLTLYNVVGGDISPSGLEILIKTYPTIYYWNRSSDENLWEVFDEEPVVLPYIEEMQGEGVISPLVKNQPGLNQTFMSIPASIHRWSSLTKSCLILCQLMMEMVNGLKSTITVI
jgi:hypothetical protein